MRSCSRASTAAVVLATLVSLSAAVATAEGKPPAAGVSVSPGSLAMTPHGEYERAVLTVTGPRSFVLRREFVPGQNIGVAVGEGDLRWPDGRYQFELRLTGRADAARRPAGPHEAEEAGRPPALDAPAARPTEVVSGGFRLQGGSIVQGTGVESNG